MADPVRITSQSGRVRVIGEARVDVTADGDPLVAEHGPREVQSKSKQLEVRVPVGTDLVVGTSSADVELRGDLGHVGITTVSGNITAKQVAPSTPARSQAAGRVREPCG